jgi:hypothetical protein
MHHSPVQGGNGQYHHYWCGLQVAAALLALQVIPGAAAGSDQQQQEQLPEPAEVPQLGPELERLLQQPSSNAKELYGLWQQGVPLEALGNMHSGSMPVSVTGADGLRGGWGWQQARHLRCELSA